VNHRCPHIVVTEQFLDSADVVAQFQKAGGKGMPVWFVHCSPFLFNAGRQSISLMDAAILPECGLVSNAGRLCANLFHMNRNICEALSQPNTC